MEPNIPATAGDSEATIRIPDQNDLAERISALDNSAAHYALFHMAFSADAAERAYLSAALNAADEWNADLAAARARMRAAQ